MHNLRLIGRHHTRAVHTVHQVHTVHDNKSSAQCTPRQQESWTVHNTPTRTESYTEVFNAGAASNCCENLQVKLNTCFEVHPLRLIGRHHTRVKHCALESHWALCRAERYISALYHTVKSTAHSQTVNIHLHPAIVKNDQRNSGDTL